MAINAFIDAKIRGAEARRTAGNAPYTTSKTWGRTETASPPIPEMALTNSKNSGVEVRTSDGIICACGTFGSISSSTLNGQAAAPTQEDSMRNAFARKQAPATRPRAAPKVLGKGTGLEGSDIIQLGVSDAACLATNRIVVDVAPSNSPTVTRTASARKTQAGSPSQETRAMSTKTKSRITASTPSTPSQTTTRFSS